MKKSFWTSKVLWTNVIALVALIIQLQTGFVVPADIQGYALIGINILLRLITKQELEM